MVSVYLFIFIENNVLSEFLNFVFCIHFGKQGRQPENELVLVCVSTSSYGREGD